VHVALVSAMLVEKAGKIRAAKPPVRVRSYYTQGVRVDAFYAPGMHTEMESD
jgi:hypothetical protein